MKISLEVSMYPLDKNYIPPISNFIDHLNTFKTLTVKTNTMSTQVFGEFDDLMSAFQTALKKSFIDTDKVVVVTKFINSDLRP